MKIPIIATLLLGLSASSLALAAESTGCTPEHEAMGHCKMEVPTKKAVPAKAKPATPVKKAKPAKAKPKQVAKPVAAAPQASACTPEHAAMGHCQMETPTGSMPASMPATTPKASTCSPEHEAMGHCTSSDKPALPVSDGSAAENIPMPFPGAMHMNDDPTLTKVMINQLETRQADQGDNPLAWEAEAWIGKDLNKLWLKTEGEKVGSKTEEAEVQALYSRAIAPFWDVQAGVRKDFKPQGREWATVGVKGLAPYHFDVDAALFAGTESRTAARLKGEYEIMLTQKTVLAPEAEINLYSKDDPAMGIGSGLADANVGLRLRHEFKREFAPYIGVNWSKKFGKTADYARDDGEKTQDTQFVAGVRLWF
jgi:copper resistance protein B